MKILMVNGSPREHGSTDKALQIMQAVFDDEKLESEIFWVGNRPLSGCLGCGLCRQTGACAINDRVNDFLDKAEESDAFVFATPVHYAAASGAITSFLDRAFYAGAAQMRLKPCACVAVARRAGTTAALEQLNKYPMINEMPVVSSFYWPMIHGANATEIEKDAEGVQTLRQLARNMAWLLKSIHAANLSPVREERARTNFIR